MNTAEKKAEKLGLSTISTLAVRDNEDGNRFPMKEIELPFPRRAWGNLENWDRFSVTCTNAVHVNRKTGRPVQIDPRDIMSFLVISDHETNEAVDAALGELENPGIPQILGVLQQHLRVAYEGPYFWPSQAHLCVAIQEKDLVKCQTFTEDAEYESYRQGLHPTVLQLIQEDQLDVYVGTETPIGRGYTRRTFFPNLQRLVEDFRRATVSTERGAGYFAPENRRKILHGLTGNVDQRCGTREVHGAFLLNLPEKGSNERGRIVFIPGIAVFAAYAVLLTALVDGTMLKHWEWFGLRIPEMAFGENEQLPQQNPAPEAPHQSEPAQKPIGTLGDALPELAELAVAEKDLLDEEEVPTLRPGQQTG